MYFNIICQYINVTCNRVINVLITLRITLLVKYILGRQVHIWSRGLYPQPERASQRQGRGGEGLSPPPRRPARARAGSPRRRRRRRRRPRAHCGSCRQ